VDAGQCFANEELGKEYTYLWIDLERFSSGLELHSSTCNIGNVQEKAELKGTDVRNASIML
jgi:hypothetical protein